MERKLIKQGGGGLTIYLPKKWTDSKKLKEGDSVSVIEKETSLIVGSSVKEKRDIEIEITDENKADLRVLLTHIYRRGFNKITINNADDSAFKETKKIVSNLLLGFGITEREGKEIVIENISEPTEQKYDVFLNRIFFLIRENFNTLSGDFSNGSFKNFSEVSEMKDDIDKHILYCRRIISRGASEKDPVTSWELLTFLMHIEHASYYLYEYLNKNPVGKEKELISLVNNLNEYFELLHNAYKEKDIKYMHKIQNLKKSYQFGKCIQLLEKSKGKETVALSFIREIFRLIQIGASPILVDIFGKEYKVE